MHVSVCFSTFYPLLQVFREESWEHQLKEEDEEIVETDKAMIKSSKLTREIHLRDLILTYRADYLLNQYHLNIYSTRLLGPYLV